MIAVVVALVLCFILIPLAAVAVDLGVQRNARGDMQALADVVALDVARQLDGRTVAQLQPVLQSVADRSAARNRTIGRPPSLRVELGTLNPAEYRPENPTGHFRPVTAPQVVPNAVRIAASTRVDFMISGGSGGATRSAIAMTNATACFKIGSYALRLSSANSALLNLLVGDALNVGALTYTGLANASVSLLGLATELGVGTPNELAALDQLSLGQLYLATARVLATEHGETADVALLNQLGHLNLGGLPRIKLGNLLGVNGAPQASLSTDVNVLDLVAGSALLSNGTNTLAVPNLTVGIPGITSVKASLKIIQAPVLTCGPVGTSQHTAQVTLGLDLGVPGIDLLGLLGLDANVTVRAELASGTATLNEIRCGPNQPEVVGVSIASALAELGVGLSANLKALGLTLLEVSGGVGTTAPPTTSNVRIQVPPGSYDQPVSSGSGVVLAGLQLRNLTVNLLGVLPLGVLLGGVLDSVLDLVVTPILNPVVNLVNTLVLGPVSDLLGLNIAGVDVFAVPKPSCTNPLLAG